MVFLTSYHFRSRVARRPAGRFKLLLTASCVHVAETKVNYFKSLVEVKQQIFWLEIPVADPTFVDIFDTRHQLLVHPDCCLLMESLVRDYVVKQLSIGAVLHDKKQFAFSLYYFIQLNNIWMPNFFKDLNLPTDPLNVFLVFNPTLFKNFNGNFLARECMVGDLHLSERSLTQGFSQDVVAQSSPLRILISIGIGVA